MSTKVTPVYSGLAEDRIDRTRDHVPSAPTRISTVLVNSGSENWSSTLSPTILQEDKVWPHLTVPGASVSRRICRSCPRSTSGLSRPGGPSPGGPPPGGPPRGGLPSESLLSSYATFPCWSI